MEGGPVDVVLLRRAYPLRNAGLGLMLFAAGGLVALSGESRILWLIALLFSGGIMALLGIEGTARRVAGRLDVVGVHVGDRIIARRRSFRAGWIERDGERTRVFVDGFRPPLRLEANDVADARRLLRLLGLDRSQTTLRFPALSAPVWGQFVMQVVLQLGYLGVRGRGLTLTHTALAILIVTVLWLATFLSLHGETVVGADGVLFSRPRGRRFVPFSEIESVDREDRGLVVRTRAGATFKRSMSAPAAQAALEAIQSSLALVHTGPETLRDRLRRTRDEDAVAWMSRVRALATPASYRTGGLAADVLWQVVDDPGASASERAAAAAALEVHATSDERQRLHEAAARMASPQVRVAIERVAARRLAGSGPFGEEPAPIGAGTSDDDDGQLTAAMASVRDG